MLLPVPVAKVFLAIRLLYAWPLNGGDIKCQSLVNVLLYVIGASTVALAIKVVSFYKRIYLTVTEFDIVG